MRVLDSQVGDCIAESIDAMSLFDQHKVVFIDCFLNIGIAGIFIQKLSRKNADKKSDVRWEARELSYARTDSHWRRCREPQVVEFTEQTHIDQCQANLPLFVSCGFTRATRHTQVWWGSALRRYWR